MDETRREALNNELKAALAEREELDTFIAVLSRRLGLSEPSRVSGGDSRNELPAIDASRPIIDSVREAQFYGKSGPKAAKALLEMVGSDRPLKTDEIYEAIKKGGVKIGSSAALYRSLFRDSRFHKVGRGVWGLSEWYPNEVRRQQTDSNDKNGDGAATEATVSTESGESAEGGVANEDQEVPGS